VAILVATLLVFSTACGGGGGGGSSTTPTPAAAGDTTAPSAEAPVISDQRVEQLATEHGITMDQNKGVVAVDTAALTSASLHTSAVVHTAGGDFTVTLHDPATGDRLVVDEVVDGNVILFFNVPPGEVEVRVVRGGAQLFAAKTMASASNKVEVRAPAAPSSPDASPTPPTTPETPASTEPPPTPPTTPETPAPTEPPPTPPTNPGSPSSELSADELAQRAMESLLATPAEASHVRSAKADFDAALAKEPNHNLALLGSAMTTMALLPESSSEIEALLGKAGYSPLNLDAIFTGGDLATKVGEAAIIDGADLQDLIESTVIPAIDDALAKLSKIGNDFQIVVSGIEADYTDVLALRTSLLTVKGLLQTTNAYNANVPDLAGFYPTYPTDAELDALASANGIVRDPTLATVVVETGKLVGGGYSQGGLVVNRIDWYDPSGSVGVELAAQGDQVVLFNVPIMWGETRITRGGDVVFASSDWPSPGEVRYYTATSTIPDYASDYPDVATLRSDGPTRLSAAQVTLLEAMDTGVAFVDALESETDDQSDDLIQQAEASADTPLRRAVIDDTRASLKGESDQITVPSSAFLERCTETYQVDLHAFFAGGVTDPRDLVPDPLTAPLPDPTWAGLFPGSTDGYPVRVATTCPTTADWNAGEALYAARCATCHGKFPTYAPSWNLSIAWEDSADLLAAVGDPTISQMASLTPLTLQEAADLEAYLDAPPRPTLRERIPATSKWTLTVTNDYGTLLSAPVTQQVTGDQVPDTTAAMEAVAQAIADDAVAPATATLGSSSSYMSSWQVRDAVGDQLTGYVYGTYPVVYSGYTYDERSSLSLVWERTE